MANLYSLNFDLDHCTEEERSESHLGWWMDSTKLAHKLQFAPDAPDWPFDLTQPDKAAKFYSRQCAENRGVMLSLDVVEAADKEALRGLFKYRAPVPDSLAMYYVGILWLPFQECRYQINVEGMEFGPTGFREATVMMLDRERWPRSEEPPINVDSSEEMFANIRSAPLRSIPSDEEKYDSMFPEHPLTLVRTRMAEVASSARLTAEANRLKPFRVRRGWQFWK